LALTHLFASKIVEPIVKYCLGTETIQVLNVSSDSQGQGFTVHVIAELGRKEVDLSESFFWPLRLFLQYRIAANSACHSQKNNTDEKKLSNSFHG
jgi:hypothetical protein